MSSIEEIINSAARDFENRTKIPLTPEHLKIFRDAFLLGRNSCGAIDAENCRNIEETNKRKIFIEGLNLPTKEFNTLTRFGFNTAEQVSQLSEDDILKFAHFGKGAVINIKAALNKIGLNLANRNRGILRRVRIGKSEDIAKELSKHLKDTSDEK